jgi:hypothetical protein
MIVIWKLIHRANNFRAKTCVYHLKLNRLKTKMRQLLPIILLLVALCLLECQAMRKQSVAVKGRLHCAGKASTGVKIKLMDKDTGWSIYLF